MPPRIESESSTTDGVNAGMRRDYALIALTINAGLALIMLAMEVGSASPRYLFVAALIDTALFLVVAAYSFPHMRSRIADRIRSESSLDYARRQRVRIWCYAGYVLSSIVFLGAQFLRAYEVGEYPMLVSASFTVSAITLLWPPYHRRKVG